MSAVQCWYCMQGHLVYKNLAAIICQLCFSRVTLRKWYAFVTEIDHVITGQSVKNLPQIGSDLYDMVVRWSQGSGLLHPFFQLEHCFETDAAICCVHYPVGEVARH